MHFIEQRRSVIDSKNYALIKLFLLLPHYLTNKYLPFTHHHHHLFFAVVVVRYCPAIAELLLEKFLLKLIVVYVFYLHLTLPLVWRTAS